MSSPAGAAWAPDSAGRRLRWRGPGIIIGGITDDVDEVFVSGNGVIPGARNLQPA